jgi:uncharacterized lipoprotein NlpE involved in copper resistance
MKKRKILTILSSAFAVVLTISMTTSLVGCNNKANENYSKDVAEDIIMMKEIQPGNVMVNQPIKLSVSPRTVAATETNTVSKTITATVMPEDAPDKSVDWSIEWCVPVSEGADISEYLTVTPEQTVH